MTTTTNKPTVTLNAKIAARITKAAEALDAARTAVAAAAVDADSDRLLALTYRVAEAEVADRQWRMVSAVAERDGSNYVAALRIVLDQSVQDILLIGADDDWSGRANELRRVKFNALRAWTVAGRRFLGID